MGLNSFDEPREDITVLTAARFDHCQQALNESTARRRLGAERELAPDHGVPQRLLGCIVGWFYTFDFDERPQMFAVLPQFLAEAADARIKVAAQQVRFYLLANRLHLLAECAARNRPIANFLPEGKQLLGWSHQVMSEAFADGTEAVDQGLEIPFQMSPAPLQTVESPVH